MTAERGWRGQLGRALLVLRPHVSAIAVILALTLAVAATSAVEPLALKYVFDRLGGDDGWTALALGIVALLGLGVVTEALAGVSNALTWRLRLRLQQELLGDTASRLYRLPLSFHHGESVGGLMTKVERGVNGFLGALTELAFNVLPSAAYLMMSLAVMVRLEWRLSLVVVAFTAVPASIGAWAVREQTLREQHLLHSWTRIYSRYYETLSGLVTVKCFGNEDDERARFVRDVGETNGVVFRGVRFDTRVGAAKNMVTLLARIAAIGVGAVLVMRGEITIGTVVAFLGYIGGIFGPVQGLTAVYETLRRATVALEAIFSVLDTPDTLADPPFAREAPRLRGEVELQDVDFSYVPGRPVLRGLDLHVRHGEKVAIVGPSGAGKTTIMWLLLRLQLPTRGVVRLDGIDVRELAQLSLRRQVGVVLQETLLFRDTVHDNIAYGCPGASRDEVESAARAAAAHEFIVRLPQGYDTILGERGATLSAGERQRIAIARALLRDPPILILDEATSNLDPESDSVVREALARLAYGRTTFIIAHRLSMAMGADRIVVLNNGRIVEVGTHGQLARSNGYYASMVRRHVALVSDSAVAS